MGENKPRLSPWFVFVTHYRASHTLGPPCVPPSPIPPSSELEPPTSLWKGEGRIQWGLAFPSKVGQLYLSPHPSREGMGLLPGCRVYLRAKWGGEDEGN